MGKLILMRHGQSLWNKLDLFTGWVDVPLSLEGIEEAMEAGKKIRDIPIDIIFTSTLVRAQMTAMLVMAQHASGKVPVMQHPEDSRLYDWGKIYNIQSKEKCVPVIAAWELNERMYGELQGMNKQETREKYGEHQVKMWRRSYDIAPPGGESLEMTAARSVHYFTHSILPKISDGYNVFIPAHGNSLRSIIMHLDALSKEEVLALELPTGAPILYEFHVGKFIKLS